MKFIKLTIRGKLILGFGIITGLVIISFTLIFFALGRNRTLSEKITNHYNPSVNELNTLTEMVSNSKMLIKNWVYIDKKEGTPDKLKLIELHKTDYLIVKENIVILEKNWSLEDTIQLNYILKTIEDTLFPLHQQVMSLLSSFESYEDPFVFFDVMSMVEEESDLMRLTDNTFTKLEALKEKIQNESNDANVSMSNSFDSFRILLIVFILIVVAGAVGITIVTTSSIISPIEKLKKLIINMSKGDIPREVNIHSNDEIGEMSEALEEFIQKLREIIGAIVNGTEKLERTSEDINTSSKNVAEGAGMQSTLAADVSASMEEMVANIQQNSDNAMQTEKIAVKAADDITTGSDSVDTAVESMKEIATKILVIGEIAQKTNILAINAAIESARAGIHGKSFAVVADQVKKLAESSQLAANDIDKLSKSSVEVAQESGNLLHDVVPNIQKTSQLVQEITASSNEQQSGSEQVNEAVIKLNEIIIQNESQAQAMTGGAQSILDQSVNLKQMVSFFKL